MLLNLGHTFGHALEAWAGYNDRLLHGEAIAIGICLAFRLSAQLGFTCRDSVDRVEAHFRALDLPLSIGDIPGQQKPEVSRLMSLMGQDKKVADGKLTLILVRGIGQAFVTRDIGHDVVRDFLAAQLAAKGA
jgi:3-dehydroquinate synthetase